MAVASRLTGRRGVSLPFTDVCSALYESQDQPDRLLREAIRHGEESGWRYLELRGCGPLPGNPSSSKYLEHNLRLTRDPDILLSNLKSSVRRAIRKSEKEGLEISVLQSLEAVRAFYALNCRTRRNHGLPPQPFTFFRNLHRNALSRGNGIVVLAAYRGKAVAASVFLHLGKRAVYKYGASDSRHYSLRGNNAVMWEAIRWYANQGFESLSLGKTRMENAGLLQFKRGWGCEESTIHYLRYDFRKGSFVEGGDHVSGWHNGVFRHLPVPLARIIGALLYRHVA